MSGAAGAGSAAGEASADSVNAAAPPTAARASAADTKVVTADAPAATAMSLTLQPRPGSGPAPVPAVAAASARTPAAPVAPAPAVAQEESAVAALVAGVFVGLLVVFRTVSYVGLFTAASPVLTPFFAALLSQLLLGNIVSQTFYLSAVTWTYTQKQRRKVALKQRGAGATLLKGVELQTTPSADGSVAALSNPLLPGAAPESSASTPASHAPWAVRASAWVRSHLKSHVPTAFIVFGQSSTIAPYISSSLATLIAALTDANGAAETDEQLVTARNTAFGFVLIAMLLIGALHYVLGRFRLGRFLSLFPYPVTRGFFAAFGVSMLLSALTLSAGFNVRKKPERLSGDGAGMAWARMCAALVFGIGLKAVKSYQTNALQLPIVMCASVGAFYVAYGIAAGVAGTTLSGLRADGWVMEIASAATATAAGGNGTLTLDAGAVAVYSFWTYYDPTKMAWSALTDRWAEFGGLLLLGAFDMSTQLPPLATLTAEQQISTTAPAVAEADAQTEEPEEMSYDEELRLSGLGQLLCAVVGAGGSCYHTVSPTKICVEAGGRTPFGALAVVCALLVNVLAMSLGPEMVSVLPTYLVSGLLIYAGVSYVLEGLWEPRDHMSGGDWVVAGVIVLFSLFFDLLVAVAIGLALACVLFIYRYASSPFVRSVYEPRHLKEGRNRRTGAGTIALLSPQTDAASPVVTAGTGDGDAKRGRVPRVGSTDSIGAVADGLQSDAGDHFASLMHGSIAVMRLQGYLFFGSAENVASRFRNLLFRSRRMGMTLSALVLDFSLVFGVDASAMDALVRLKKSTAQHHVQLIVSGVGRRTALRQQMDRARPELLNDALHPLKVFDKLDAAIDFAEHNQLITARGGVVAALVADPKPLATAMAASTGSGSGGSTGADLKTHTADGNIVRVVVQPSAGTVVTAATPLLATPSVATASTAVSVANIRVSSDAELCAESRRCGHAALLPAALALLPYDALLVRVFREQLAASRYVSADSLAQRLHALLPQMLVLGVASGQCVVLPPPLQGDGYVFFLESGEVELQLPYRPDADTDANGDPNTAATTGAGVGVGDDADDHTAPSKPVGSAADSASHAIAQGRGGGGGASALDVDGLSAAASYAAHSLADALQPAVNFASSAVAKLATAFDSASSAADSVDGKSRSEAAAAGAAAAAAGVAARAGGGAAVQPVQRRDGDADREKSVRRDAVRVATLRAGDVFNIRHLYAAERGRTRGYGLGVDVTRDPAEANANAAISSAIVSSDRDIGRDVTAMNSADDVVFVAASDCVVRALAVWDILRLEESEPAYAMVLHRLVARSALSRWWITADTLLNQI